MHLDNRHKTGLTRVYRQHPIFIDVNVLFSQISGSIHQVRCRNELCQLTLVIVAFLTTKVLSNISSFRDLIVFQYFADLFSTCPGLIIQCYNTQMYCVKGKWHIRRHFICGSFWSKNFVFRQQIQNSEKKPFFIVFNHFHNPHFQHLVHGQDLSCSLYAQPLKQAQENYQKYTLKDNLMIGSFSISCCNFFTSLILTT